MPIDHDRSRVQEARVAGLAITLSVVALILVVVYVVGGYANRVVIELVAPSAVPAAGATVASSATFASSATVSLAAFGRIPG